MVDAATHEIDLREFLKLLWRFRLAVLCITLFVTAIISWIAWMLPPKYQASVLISPVSNVPDGGGGRLAALASEAGALGSLMGLTVGNDTNKTESIAVLQSVALTEQFISENHLLPILFKDRWDPYREDWRISKSKRRSPTLWEAERLFDSSIRTVTEDRRTGLVRLTITWKDPAQAAQWANGLVALTNHYLQQRAITESERHIAYLDKQASLTDVAEIRTAIYNMLETEIKNVMMAKGTDQYALKVLDPAVVPERKSSPHRAEWMLGGFFGGLFIAILTVIVSVSLTTDRANRPSSS